MPWYIVQTKPTTEQQVCERWRQVGYTVFLPLIRTVVRGAKRVHGRTRPLFPSYLFVDVDLTDATVIRNIKYTRGVRKILGNGREPIPVADAVIEVIRERVDGEGVLVQQLLFKKGDSVRIRRGPLADLVGVLEKPVSAEGRVRVLLTVYSKTIRADLSSAEIERL